MSDDITRARARMKQLVDEIAHHDFKYSAEDSPEISDREYDLLMMELKSLEAKYPDLVQPDSPTQRVSGMPLDRFPQVEHKVSMLSLGNCYSPEELKEFDARVRKALGEDQRVEYVVEPKIDGLGIALLYENGQLVRGGVTSGNCRRNAPPAVGVLSVSLLLEAT